MINKCKKIFEKKSKKKDSRSCPMIAVRNPEKLISLQRL